MATGGKGSFSQFSDVEMYGRPELDQLMNWIGAKVSPDWYKIGIQLKLETAKLDEIKANSTLAGSVVDMFSELMMLWRDNPQPGAPYTWETILDVLVCESIKKVTLAYEVAEKIKTKPMLKTEQSVQSFTSFTSSGSNDSAYYTDDDLKKLCGCGECSLEDIIDKGCSRPDAMARFPILDVTRLEPCKRQQYEYTLIEQAEKINEEFAELIDDISKSMSDGQTDPKGVKIFLFGKKIFQTTADNSYLSQLRAQLNQAQDISDIFIVLSQITSWFNHHPLGSLVNRYGSKEDKEAYKKFVDDNVMKYLQRSVTEIPKDAFCPGIEGSGKFTVKLDHPLSHEHITGQQLLFLQGKVARALGIPIDCLHMCSIKKGCLEVIFNIPLAIYKEVFFSFSCEHAQALADIVVEGQDVTVRVTSICYDGKYHDIPFKESIPEITNDMLVVKAASNSISEKKPSKTSPTLVACQKKISQLHFLALLPHLPNIANQFEQAVTNMLLLFNEASNDLSDFQKNESFSKFKKPKEFNEALKKTKDAMFAYFEKILLLFREVTEKCNKSITDIELEKSIHAFNQDLQCILKEINSSYEALKTTIQSLNNSCDITEFESKSTKKISKRKYHHSLYDDSDDDETPSFKGPVAADIKSASTFKRVTQVFGGLNIQLFSDLQDIISQNSHEQEYTEENFIETIMTAQQNARANYKQVKTSFKQCKMSFCK